MKEQKSLSADGLKAAFDSQKEKNLAEWTQYNVISVVEALSKALKDLRDIGVEVQLQLVGTPSADAFSLVRTVRPGLTSLVVTISGILNINQVEYLLAICLEENKKSVLKIYISDFDYKGQGAKQGIRGICFDLNEDSEAIQKLQKYIILMSARNEILREHDVCNVFENTGMRRLNKSVPRKPGPKS